MINLGKRIFSIEFQDSRNADEEAIVRLMEDQIYVPYRRRLLPTSLTSGREVYAFDLLGVGEFLPSGTVETPLIPCMAERGAEGRIEMLPSSVVASAFAEQDRQQA
jgi:hypothetical protein